MNVAPESPTGRHDRPRPATIAPLLVALLLAAAPPALAQRLPLGLRQAITLALSEEGNTQVRLARERIQGARARSSGFRAALLPRLEGSVSALDQTRNLESLGLQAAGAFRPPVLVGPFSTFDLRARLDQNLFHLGAIHRYQASKAGVSASRLEQEMAEEETAAAAARAYLAGLYSGARLEAARADLELAAALLELAQDRKQAGTGTGIEVTRASVEHAHQQQRLMAAELERRRSLLELSRVLGLPPEVELELTDTLGYQPGRTTSPEAAIELALGARPDLKARMIREEQSRLSHSAERLDRVPSLAGFLDYGTIGSGPHNTIPTWSLGLTLRVPLFDGGRMEAEKAEQLSLLRQESLQKEDLARQIRLEVRLALDGLRLAEEQIRVAEEGLRLAEQELEAARRRYQAGFTTSLEVTQAQARLERAREERISSLFHHNLQRIELARGTGTARQLAR